MLKENKKFIFSAVRESARAREYGDAIQWLVDANLLYRSVNVKVPKVPLAAYEDATAFKLYMNDVGLLGALSNLESSAIVEGNRLFIEFKGALMENYVASVLANKFDHKLYYWTSGNKAEVDFLTYYNEQLYPLEVKSGFSGKQKSLRIYVDKYGSEIANKATPMNLKQDGIYYNYPLYLMDRYPLL